MIMSIRQLAMVAISAFALLFSFGVSARGDEKPPVKIEYKGWFSNPVFSADGKTLTYAQLAALPFGARTAPTQIVLWDLKAGKETKRIDGPADDSFLGSIAVSGDGKRLALCMWNTSLRVWDIDMGKEVCKPANSQGAQHLCFDRDGGTVGWVRDGEIRLADTANAKALGQVAKDADAPVTMLAFLDGKNLLAGTFQSKEIGPGGKNRTLEHQISFWARDGATGKKLRQVGVTATEQRKRFDGPPTSAAFVSADRKTVVIAGDRGTMQLCDAGSGKKLKEMPVPWNAPANDPLRRLAFSSDLKVAAVCTAQGVVTVWDLATGKEIQRVQTGQSIDHLALAPDGKTMAITHQTPGQVGAVLLIFSF